MASIQDNKDRELDPALIDNAWMQMEQELDRAMPRKKRGAFWWLTGLAGIVVLLLNIYLFGKGSGQNSSVPAVVTEKEAVIADNTNTAEQNVYQQNDELLSETPTPTVPVEGRLVEQEVASSFAVEQAPTSSFQQAPIDEENDRSENTIDYQTDPAPSSIIVNAEGSTRLNNVTAELLVNENRPSIVSETSELITANRSPAVTAISYLLPTISDFPFSTANSHLPVNVAEVKPVSPWNYYLEGQGGVSLTTADYSSIAIGAGVQRDLGTKWNVELGAQYQLNKRSFFVGRNQDNAFADELQPNTGSGYSVERTLAFQNLETSRLNLYLGGSYQVSPRFSLGMSVQGSYFTKAFAIFESSSTAVNQPLENDPNGLRVDLYEGVLSVYDLDSITNAVNGPFAIDANRLQWSLNGSARYQFAKHWEAALQYQHHLTAWPSKQEPFGGLSALQLGLRYYLR
ncbi:hypothetical protein [Lewinella cohaerens]|uniref:hypothetical protein n=1 Tax=Lewinella cohaerens TaxID=70995 RepID=UPI000373499C|nr:hypothetical protein [Lewinella cohaerens]